MAGGVFVGPSLQVEAQEAAQRACWGEDACQVGKKEVAVMAVAEMGSLVGKQRPPFDVV